MDFIDRLEEMSRLTELTSRAEGGLGVLSGRRRIGKTRLLLEWVKRNDGLYTVCDRSTGSIQRRYLAQELERRFAGFDDVVYPTWTSLLKRLARELEGARWKGPLVLDEFPYAVESDQGLSSVLQNWIDHDAKRLKLVVAISGSSQRMMQGFVLDSTAPLFGRASVLLDLKPLKAGYIREALGLSGDREAVEAFSVWGGVPRYWELAEPFGDDLSKAVDRCVLDPLSPLHGEPDRLLLEETPPAHSVRPLLDAIGSGANRLTEIGARLGQPATSLARPLARLQGLSLIQREMPYGDSEKSGKRALYKISDPFSRFWFRVVAPNRSLLAQSPAQVRLAVWRRAQPGLAAEAWEDLCRQSVPYLTSADNALAELGPWGIAGRFWRKNGPEWDIVARSLEGTRLLLGEARWRRNDETVTTLEAAARELISKGTPEVPGVVNPRIVHALFVAKARKGAMTSQGVHVIDARTVLTCMR